MKLVEVFLRVLTDVGIQVGANKDEIRLSADLILSRVDSEGEEVLTIQLPEFAKDFERSLDEGKIVESGFQRWKKDSAGRPMFLGFVLSAIFDSDGLLRADVDPFHVYCVRQVTLLFKKTHAVASPKRQRAASEAYVSVEETIDLGWSNDRFSFVAGVVMAQIFGQAQTEFHPADLLPTHGPGATADSQTPNGKWEFRTWHERLERNFMFYSDHCLPNYGWDNDPSLPHVEIVSEEREQPVKVVFVPKTVKTPRVIAIEPACMQYMQQGLMRYLVALIERAPLTKGRVNFSDQTVNQRLALQSSADGRYATLDMSEASDRVSYRHAECLFRAHPNFWACVDASRSRRAELPDGRILDLKKFASMGSALCFPVEALAFFVAIISARMESRAMTNTAQNVAKVAQDVYVYGDDILVPTDEAPAVCDYLELQGFKVNHNKSFWSGKFRESCGIDAYSGEEVTPVYCRYPVPNDRTDSEALISYVALANGLHSRGLWYSAAFVRTIVEEILGELPARPTPGQGLHWTTFSKLSSVSRWNSKLHRFEVKAWVPHPRHRKDELDGAPALLKCLRGLEARMLSERADKRLIESMFATLCCNASMDDESTGRDLDLAIPADGLDGGKLTFVTANLRTVQAQLAALTALTSVVDREVGHLLTSAIPWSIRLKARWVPVG